MNMIPITVENEMVSQQTPSEAMCVDVNCQVSISTVRVELIITTQHTN